MKVFFSVREGSTTSTTVPFVKPAGTVTAQVLTRTPNTSNWVVSNKVTVTVNTDSIVLTIVQADATAANWPRDFRVNLTNGSRVWTYINGTVYFQTAPGGAGDGSIADSGVTAVKLATDAVTTPKVLNGAITAAKLNADVVEFIQDVLSTSVVAGTNVSLAYNDAANTLTISSTGGTGGLDEEAVNDRIAAVVQAGAGISITNNDAGNTVTVAFNGTKATVGLGNVDNTSDANKPVSTATQTALNLKANTSHAHATGDITDLLEYLQDSVNTMIVAGSNVTKSYDDATGLLTINAAGGGGGTTDAEIVRDTIAGALVAGANINITVDDVLDTINIAVTGLTKTTVGLANVDNTSDANKPVSTAQQTALNLKANLASPTFTGTVSGITAAMVGLGNVNNTSDANKPVSTATQTALNGKANTTHTHVRADVTDIGAKVIVLNAAEAVPGGTPVGTVILRRP